MLKKVNFSSAFFAPCATCDNKFRMQMRKVGSVLVNDMQTPPPPQKESIFLVQKVA